MKLQKQNLIHVIEKGDMAEVTRFFAEPSTVNLRDDEYGASPLEAAILDYKIDIFEWLLKKGADPNSRDKVGYTPLFCACNMVTDHCPANYVSLLLQYGADPNARVDYNPLNNCDKEGANGYTAAMKAAGHGHADVLQILIDHGADMFLPNAKGITAEMIAKGYRHSFVNKNGDPILHSLRNAGHDACVNIIAKHKAELAAQASLKGLATNIQTLPRIKIRHKGQTP